MPEEVNKVTETVEPVVEPVEKVNEPEDKTDWKQEARKWEKLAKQNNKLASDNEAGAQKAATLEQRIALIEKENHSLKLAKIAKEYNLPDGFAERLKGSTTEELEADAKQLSEMFPAAKADVSKKTLLRFQGNKQKEASKTVVTNKEELLAHLKANK